MSGPPAPPNQLSPDGKWWWDGTRWTPVAPSTALAAGSGAVTPYARSTNGLAIASLVFAIASWFVCPFVGGVLAVILGHIARGQIRRTGEAGGGLAMAGLILGYIHLGIAIVAGIIWLALVVGFFGTLGTLGTASPTPSLLP